MKTNKLDCCIVRDLLPSYIEELTEPETSEQVAAHLESCADCKTLEQDMRMQVPINPVPKKSLQFLKKVQHTRVLAAILVAVLTVLCACFVYHSSFHYANTEAGRLTAVEDYIQQLSSIESYAIEEDTPIHIVGYQEYENYLFVSFSIDNEYNFHGAVQLIRGINGKYRPCNLECSIFPYFAGVWHCSFDIGKADSTGEIKRVHILTGEGCRDIYSVQLTYYYMNTDDWAEHPAIYTYSIEEANFIDVMDYAELQSKLDLADKDLLYITLDDVRFLDKNGNDITEQFRDSSISQISTADGSLISGFATGFSASRENVAPLTELFILLIGIAGIVIIVQILRRG